MKIALFKSIEYGWTLPFEQHDDGSDPCLQNYIRVTGYVDVDFPLRAPEEIVPAQLAAIDKAEQHARAEFQLKLNAFAEARANVRALTHSPAPGAAPESP